MKLTLLSDVAKFTLKPNVRKGKNDNLGIVDSNFTAAMAPYLMSSIVGIKVPSFIITAAAELKYVRQLIIMDLKLRKLNLLMGRDLS
jgi:hypothetical protein